MLLLKALVVSFAGSVLSVLIVVYSFNMYPSEQGVRVSPYWNEINQLLAKGETGITPEEKKYLDELIDKNNLWHEEARKTDLARLQAHPDAEFSKRSSSLAPAIAALWGLSFYFLYRQKPTWHGLLVVTFPVIFALNGPMSLFAWVLILVSVVAIWCWLSFRKSPK